MNNCSTGEYSSNKDFKCTPYVSTSLYDCTAKYMESKSTCSDIDVSQRYVNITAVNLSMTSFYAVQSGYNIIQPVNLLAQPGYVLALRLQNAQVAIDTNASTAVSDAYFRFNAGFKFYGLYSNQNQRVMARVFVQPVTRTISTFKRYSAPGNYTINVKLTNNLINLAAKSNNTQVSVFYPITSVSIKTDFCELNLPCNLTCKVKSCDPSSLACIDVSSSNIAYFWTLDGHTFNTTSPVVSYTFTMRGVYPVTVLVMNQISNGSNSKKIPISSEITGLSFYAGKSIQSASIVGKVASFLFSIATGSFYTCSIDFGDDTQIITITDRPYNLNNTFIKHVYANAIEAMYKVYINCSNSDNSTSLLFDHYAQYELTGLALVKYGTLVNTAYSVDFMVSSGSAPFYLEARINNGVNDTGVSKDIGSNPPVTIYRGMRLKYYKNAILDSTLRFFLDFWFLFKYENIFGTRIWTQFKVF